MRVAVFTDNDFNKVNGVTTTLSAMLEHAPADIRPRIYTAAALGCDQPDYYALRSRAVPIPFYSEMQMYVPKWRQYLKRVVEDHIDVIHLTTPGPLGLTALWVAKTTRLPLVGSFHTDLGTYTTVLSGWERLGRLMNEYMRWMYGCCQAVLVPSVATRTALINQGLPWERLAIWPRGVNTTLFDPARRSSVLRAAWRSDDDHPVLLYVGRVSREKSVGLLPAMLGGLRARGLACRLVIAGDGPYRRELADACPEAIFTGTLGREAVADAFASADLFVFPSRTDTAGNVVLEAQASGMPVVVSSAGGPRENMLPDRSGVVCHTETAAEWAERIATLLRDTGARDTMRVTAREYALSRRWDVALEPLYRAYREVVSTTTEAHAAPLIPASGCAS
jgi:glycosyltransferase involved in cell wall biosynthesis